jgi:hypothetical protein
VTLAGYILEYCSVRILDAELGDEELSDRGCETNLGMSRGDARDGDVLRTGSCAGNVWRGVNMAGLGRDDSRAANMLVGGRVILGRPTSAD